MKNNLCLLLFSAVIVVNACSRQPGETSGENTMQKIKTVFLTNEQLSQAEIKTTRLKKEAVTDPVVCSGFIEADPNHEALVNPPMKGYIKKILVHVGDHIESGEALTILEHADYIELQEEYLEVKSRYDYFKEDFKRQGELTMENASSIKKMQQAQSEFRICEARLLALEKQLMLLGIRTDSLTVENIRSEITLRTPIKGYITEVNGKIGMLCEEDFPVFLVVNNQKADLHLKIGEKDLTRISVQQPVEFTLKSSPNQLYKAKIRVINQTISENGSINLYADIINTKNDLMPGMFVNAKILNCTDSVYLLQREWIIVSEGKQFIFLKTDTLQFELATIETARKFDNRFELINPAPELTQLEIVISGSDYLYKKLKSQE